MSRTRNECDYCRFTVLNSSKPFKKYIYQLFFLCFSKIEDGVRLVSSHLCGFLEVAVIKFFSVSNICLHLYELQCGMFSVKFACLFVQMKGYAVAQLVEAMR
jgi:hypothetical protein